MTPTSPPAISGVRIGITVYVLLLLGIGLVAPLDWLANPVPGRGLNSLLALLMVSLPGALVPLVPVGLMLQERALRRGTIEVDDPLALAARRKVAFGLWVVATPVMGLAWLGVLYLWGSGLSSGDYEVNGPPLGLIAAWSSLLFVYAFACRRAFVVGGLSFD